MNRTRTMLVVVAAMFGVATLAAPAANAASTSSASTESALGKTGPCQYTKPVAGKYGRTVLKPYGAGTHVSGSVNGLFPGQVNEVWLAQLYNNDAGTGIGGCGGFKVTTITANKAGSAKFDGVVDQIGRGVPVQVIIAPFFLSFDSIVSTYMTSP